MRLASLSVAATLLLSARCLAFECNEAHISVINDNVTVKAGDSCVLMLGASVVGNVSQQGGILVIESTVWGDVQISGSSSFTLSGAVVGNNLSIYGVAGSGEVANTTVLNNADVEQNSSPIDFSGDRVENNMVCINNNPPLTGGSNVVSGNIFGQCP